MTQITNVLCEYRHNPLGIDVKRPRFSFQLECDRYLSFQKAFRIVVSTSAQNLRAGVYDLWDSGMIEGSNTLNIEYGGKRLVSRMECFYKIFSLMDDGSLAESNTYTFETAFLHRSDFIAHWVGYKLPGRQDPARGEFNEGLPCPYLRKSFTVRQGLKKARLYTTALGLYSFKINGLSVTDDKLTPGWTDYDKMLQYQTYNLTAALSPGENVISVILGDGWYAGCMGLFGRGYYGGYPLCYFAQVELYYEDGTSEAVITDESWKASCGKLQAADLFMGERHDLSKEPVGWELPGFNDSSWNSVVKFAYEGTPFHGDFVAQINPPVRINETLSPIYVKRISDDRYICDMGQNMVGWVRLKLACKKRTAVTLRFGEMLNSDGTLYVENLRLAKATDEIICDGSQAVFEPCFTFHGFRYVEISGLGYEPLTDDITGCVLYSSMEATGSFRCSDELVNRLSQNILWGQKGNFLDVPTDCPQRDERLGWTGDTQVFAKSACCNMNMSAFYTKTSMDLELGQRLNGAFPDVAPYVNLHKCVESLTGNKDAGNPAWAECGIIVPYTVYLFYNDARILKKHYHSMERYMEYLIDDSDGFIRRDTGYSDWLSINDTTPAEVTGTAFFAYSASLMEKISGVLGYTERQTFYNDLFKSVSSAFTQRYVNASTGEIYGNTQTCYLLALKMGLCPSHMNGLFIENLLTKIKNNGGHISSGFVGVSYMLPVLSDFGRYDAAYDLLLKDTYPSWLYSVKNGATTIWERWNSYTLEDGFGDVGMNSFNHYSLGSIAEWLFQYMGGIRLDEASPGYHAFTLKPNVDKRIPEACIDYRSASGKISSSFSYKDGCITYSFFIPCNTTARIILRKPSPFSEYRIELGSEGIRPEDENDEYFIFTAGAGKYNVKIK